MFEIIALALLGIILWNTGRNTMLNQKLQTSIDSLLAETADTNGKLASITTFVTGVPDLVATAVAAALAASNVDEEAAAELIDEARQTISDNVDQALSAIDQNPSEADTAGADTGGAGTGGDTSTGTDTSGAGTAGDDTSGAGAGDQSGAGSDTAAEGAGDGTTGADAGAGDGAGTGEGGGEPTE